MVVRCVNRISMLRSYASWWKEDVDSAMPMLEDLTAAEEANQRHDRIAVRKHLRDMQIKLTGLRRLVLKEDLDRFQLLLGAMSLPDGSDLGRRS